MALNIEEPEELLAYLRSTGRLEPGEVPVFTTLPGGVSNRTVLVRRSGGEDYVLKQALAKLRVAVDWFSDPSRIHREALGLTWLARLAPPGSITPLLFEDPEENLLAMAAVPQPHENWKSRLLTGRLDPEHARQFGRILGTIHREGRSRREELLAIFGDRTFFETLRLEPYYCYAASRNPEAGDFVALLVAETRATQETLVHGDYSPKNVLLYQDRLVLLDHEVIHFGDPAFDLGFSLTHFLSKAHHFPEMRIAFLEAAASFWRSYVQTAGLSSEAEILERRAVRHTIGCLLARVDGRSPLEYLTPSGQTRQRAVALSLMKSAPPGISELIDRFDRALGVGIESLTRSTLSKIPIPNHDHH